MATFTGPFTGRTIDITNTTHTRRTWRQSWSDIESGIPESHAVIDWNRERAEALRRAALAEARSIVGNVRPNDEHDPEL